MGDGTIQGREYLIDIFIAELGKWKEIGGVQTRGKTLSVPTSDVTSTSTKGNYTSNAASGYKSLTMNVSGVVDTTDDEQTAGFAVLSDIVNTNPRAEARLRMRNPIEQLEGVFIISNFEDNAEQQDQMKFSATFQSKGEISRLPAG